MLQTFAEHHELGHAADNAEIMLADTNAGLELCWQKQPGQKPLKYTIDVDQFVSQQKTFPAAKQGAFNQALGKKSKHIIDATGGWGSDTLLMCAQGYQVTIIERHPLMALLLMDAMQRLARTDWADSNAVKIPHVIEGNAIDLLSQQGLSADCVYLDPMFPLKKKKSAAVNKNMQFLQWLLTADCDADDLLRAALSGTSSRVAVKRPDYAQPLLTDSLQPSTQFSSKLIHYDVYLDAQVN